MPINLTISSLIDLFAKFGSKPVKRFDKNVTLLQRLTCVCAKNIEQGNYLCIHSISLSSKRNWLVNATKNQYNFLCNKLRIWLFQQISLISYRCTVKYNRKWFGKVKFHPTFFWHVAVRKFSKSYFPSLLSKSNRM